MWKRDTERNVVMGVNRAKRRFRQGAPTEIARSKKKEGSKARGAELGHRTITAAARKTLGRSYQELKNQAVIKRAGERGAQEMGGGPRDRASGEAAHGHNGTKTPLGTTSSW